MTKVSFEVDVDSLEARPSGAITANIFLRLGGREFPTQNWNDFAVVITEWWASALLRLLKGSSNQELVDFMDGPYAVEIRAISSEKLSFRALHGVNRDIEVAVDLEVSVTQFVRDFICQAQSLLSACRRRNYWTDDVDLLQASLHVLCKESIRALNLPHGRHGGPT